MPRFGGMGGAFGRMGAGGAVQASSSSAVVFSLTWTDGTAESSGGTTIDYGTRAFGAADANRRIVVFVGARMTTNNTITSVSIGGVAATAVLGTAASIAGSQNTQIWQADVPAGTTGNVTVVFGAAAARTGISVYRLITATATATSSSTTTSASATSLGAAITIPSGGAGLAGAIEGFASNAVTWTNSTEDFEGTTAGPLLIGSASSTTSGSVTPTASWTGSTSGAYSAAAWGS